MPQQNVMLDDPARAHQSATQNSLVSADDKPKNKKKSNFKKAKLPNSQTQSIEERIEVGITSSPPFNSNQQTFPSSADPASPKVANVNVTSTKNQAKLQKKTEPINTEAKEVIMNKNENV